MSDFPTDDTTLTLLIAASKINPDTGRTHLHDFLDMGTRIKDQTLIAGSEDPDDGDIPVYEVEYQEGYEPFSEHHVIRTLAREVMETRAELAKAQTATPETGCVPRSYNLPWWRRWRK